MPRFSAFPSRWHCVAWSDLVEPNALGVSRFCLAADGLVESMSVLYAADVGPNLPSISFKLPNGDKGMGIIG